MLKFIDIIQTIPIFASEKILTTMKNILTFCLVCFLATQINAQDKNIDAFISYGTFNIIGESNSPYIETYITFDCNSLVYVKNQNEYEASINLTVLFKQGESIKNYDKYSVTSPKVADTSNVNGFFMDVQRYSLANGEYQMEITIEDANNTNKPLQVSETIVVDYPETICFSSIIALEDYKPSEEASTNSKNGYDIVPMIMPYYPESINRLTFYAEIYNTKKILGENEKYLLNTYLKTFESNTIVNNYFFTKRMNVKDTEVVINTMDISNLPSGNYYLVLEVRDRNNEVIGYNQFFFLTMKLTTPYWQQLTQKKSSAETSTTLILSENILEHWKLFLHKLKKNMHLTLSRLMTSRPCNNISIASGQAVTPCRHK